MTNPVIILYSYMAISDVIPAWILRPGFLLSQQICIAPEKKKQNHEVRQTINAAICHSFICL